MSNFCFCCKAWNEECGERGGGRRGEVDFCCRCPSPCPARVRRVRRRRFCHCAATPRRSAAAPQKQTWMDCWTMSPSLLQTPKPTPAAMRVGRESGIGSETGSGRRTDGDQGDGCERRRPSKPSLEVVGSLVGNGNRSSPLPVAPGHPAPLPIHPSVREAPKST